MIQPEVKRIIRESLPIVLFSGIFILFAGILLTTVEEYFTLFPGLLIMIPPLLNIRGCIASSLGSRIGSALHLGVIKPKFYFSKELKENLKGSIVLNIVMGILIGVFAFIANTVLNQPTISIVSFLFVGVLTALLAGIILSIATIIIAIISYKKGLDPDDVVCPTITTFGDAVTIFCLIFILKIWSIVGTNIGI